MVLTFAFYAADVPRCADTATTATAVDIGGIIHTTTDGGKGDSEDQPWNGGVLMPTAMHDRKHEYIPIARVVLAFTFTTGAVHLFAVTDTTAM